MSKSPENCRFREHDWELLSAEKEISYARYNEWLRHEYRGGPSGDLSVPTARWKCLICYARIVREIDQLEFEDLRQELATRVRKRNEP